VQIHVNTIAEYFLLKSAVKKNLQFEIAGVSESDATKLHCNQSRQCAGGFSISLTAVKQGSLKRSQVIPLYLSDDMKKWVHLGL